MKKRRIPESSCFKISQKINFARSKCSIFRTYFLRNMQLSSSSSSSKTWKHTDQIFIL